MAEAHYLKVWKKIPFGMWIVYEIVQSKIKFLGKVRVQLKLMEFAWKLSMSLLDRKEHWELMGNIILIIIV